MMRGRSTLLSSLSSLRSFSAPRTVSGTLLMWHLLYPASAGFGVQLLQAAHADVAEVTQRQAARPRPPAMVV